MAKAVRGALPVVLVAVLAALAVGGATLGTRGLHGPPLATPTPAPSVTPTMITPFSSPAVTPAPTITVETGAPRVAVTLTLGARLGPLPQPSGVNAWDFQRVLNFPDLLPRVLMTRVRVMDFVDKLYQAQQPDYARLDAGIETLLSAGKTPQLVLSTRVITRAQDLNAERWTAAVQAMLIHLHDAFGRRANVGDWHLEGGNEEPSELMIPLYYANALGVARAEAATGVTMTLGGPSAIRHGYGDVAAFLKAVKGGLRCNELAVHWYLEGANGQTITWEQEKQRLDDIQARAGTALPYVVTEWSVDGEADDPRLSTAYASAFVVSTLADPTFPVTRSFFSGLVGMPPSRRGAGHLALWGNDAARTSYPVADAFVAWARLGPDRYDVLGGTATTGAVSDGTRWLIWNFADPLVARVGGRVVEIDGPGILLVE